MIKAGKDMNGRERFYQWAIGILIGMVIFMAGQRYGETALSLCMADIADNDRRIYGIEKDIPEIKEDIGEIKKDFKALLTELREDAK